MALTYRQNEILEFLKDKKHAKVGEIATQIISSEATARRELAELERLGLLKRDHGGAIILENADEISIFVRQTLGTDDKEATSEIAADKLPDFKTVFIDNSSTALIFTQRMNFSHKTVMTNGVILAMQLAKKQDVTVLMPGGELGYNTNSLTGYATIRHIERMQFNLMICSCAGINERGTFENSHAQCEIKRTALKNSSYKVLLVDKTKFNDTETYLTCPLDEYDAIFTKADDNIIMPYLMKGINIVNK